MYGETLRIGIFVKYLSRSLVNHVVAEICPKAPKQSTLIELVRMFTV
jgi:hypothetical protein